MNPSFLKVTTYTLTWLRDWRPNGAIWINVESIQYIIPEGEFYRVYFANCSTITIDSEDFNEILLLRDEEAY